MAERTYVLAFGRDYLNPRTERKVATAERIINAFRKFHVIPLTQAEYAALDSRGKAVQKKASGFVIGGDFGEGKRKEDCVSRSIVTLDMDDLTTETAATVIWTLQDLGHKGFIYSTASHTVEKPRLRAFIFLSSDVLPDQYHALVQYFANILPAGAISSETYKVSQVMYRPQACSDGVQVFIELVGEPLNPLPILENLTPVSSHKSEATPAWEKPGIVGRVGARYEGDFDRAIEELGLPYRRSPVGPTCAVGEDRYTYTGGAGTDGAIWYRGDGHLYSHHGTDPARGQNCTVFDVYRLHNCNPRADDESAPIAERASHKAAEAFFVGKFPEMGRQPASSEELEDISSEVTVTTHELDTSGESKTYGRFTPIPAEQFIGGGRLKWWVKFLIPQAELGLLFGDSGAGKAQPLDESVLTPDGWRPMGDIRQGDYVIGSSGFPVKVLQVHPRGKLDEWKITLSNGNEIRCSGDHLWRVQIKGTHWETLSTKQLDKHPRRNCRIPLTGPVNYTPNRNPLPIDPYLLGALIGDGGLTAYCGFSSGDEEILNEIRARIPAGHFLHSVKNAKYGYRINSARGQPNHVWNALRFMGLAGKKSQDKFIPEEYMHASPADRLLLLQGLMDTDGYAPGGKASYEAAWSSRKLVEQVRELVGSLGGIPGQIRTKKTTHLDCYRMNFRMPQGLNAFRLTRKAERITNGHAVNIRMEKIERTGRKVPMQCITVAANDHLYVTKDFTVTHNSFVAYDLATAIHVGGVWNGKKVIKGKNVYVCAEGTDGFRQRVEARAKAGDHDIRELPPVVPAAPNVLETEDIKDLILAIKAEGDVAVVWLDTLAAVTPGADENTSTDMGKLVANCKLIHRKTGAMVILVHHTGKDLSKGARGHSSIRAAMDVMLEVTRNNEVRKIGVYKAKDGEDREQMMFGLKRIVLGIDEDGDEISSCVPEYYEGPIVAALKPLNPAQQTVFEETRRLILNGVTSARDIYDLAKLKLPVDESGRDRRAQQVRRLIAQIVDKGGRLYLHNGGEKVTLSPSTEVPAVEFEE